MISKKSKTNDLIKTVASIAGNYELKQYALNIDLDIIKIAWEDTARNKDSCWGPNISDLTLQLDHSKTLLPIIRKPNFDDVTIDLPIKAFDVSIGNEDNKFDQLVKIPFLDYLDCPSAYISNKNEMSSLYDKERDKHILTSVQFCILPVEKEACEFNVQVLNYQSDRTPAVLIIVANSEGTSAQILCGKTPLYFNEKGMACNFTAERLKEVRRRNNESEAKEMTQEEKEKNCLFIFQVPLKQFPIKSNIITAKTGKHGHAKTLGTDDGQLSHGEPHSEFKGVQDRKIVRDFNYPIRCTLQYYKVTDTDEIPTTLLDEMKSKIDDVFSWAIKEGSLVVEGETDRKTESIK